MNAGFPFHLLKNLKTRSSDGEKTVRGQPRKLSHFPLCMQESFDGCGVEFRWSRAHDDSSALIFKVVQAFLEKKAGPKPKPKHQNTPALTPLGVLKTLKEAMEDEERALRFDMPGLNTRCIELLRRVQKEGFPPTGLVKDLDAALRKMNSKIHTALLNPKAQDVLRLMKVSSFIADVIPLEGNATYFDAISQMRIVRGPMTLEWEAAQLHTERVFGGVNSAEMYITAGMKLQVMASIGS